MKTTYYVWKVTYELEQVYPYQKPERYVVSRPVITRAKELSAIQPEIEKTLGIYVSLAQVISVEFLGEAINNQME